MDSRVGWFHDLLDMPLRVKEIWQKMTDMSTVLDDIATKMRGPLATSITELVAENTRLRQENADLTDEDVAESAAAQNVVTAYNEVAGLFAPTDVPADVPTLPTDESSSPAAEESTQGL